MTFLTRDRALALVTLAFVAVFAIESSDIPPRSSWQPYGSAFYPRLLLGVIAAFALLLLGRSFLPNAPRQAPVFPDIIGFLKANSRILGVFALFGLYVALLPLVGYIAATMGFLLATLGLLAGFENRRKAFVTIVTGIVVPLLVYATFHYGLGIRLP